MEVITLDLYVHFLIFDYRPLTYIKLRKHGKLRQSDGNKEVTVLQRCPLEEFRDFFPQGTSLHVTPLCLDANRKLLHMLK